MSLKYLISATTTPAQFALDKVSSDSKLFNSLQSKNFMTDFINIESNFNNYNTLNYGRINIDSNRIILNGETQIRFLGNIRVWQLAAIFLLSSILLSEYFYFSFNLVYTFLFI